MKYAFLVVILLCCLGILAPYRRAEDTSMVLYLPLDENSGNIAYDLSKYKNDAFLKGKAKWAPGKFNSGIELGVGNYLEVSDSDSLDITTSVTISCWAKIMGLTGAHQSGVEKGRAWSSGEYNLLPEYSGGVLLQMFDLPEECDDEAIGRSVADGEWHFITGTWDGKVIRIYVDAKESKSLPCPGELIPNNDPLFIGCRGGSERWLNGFIDEIKIYNRALSIEEIKRDMDDPRANLSVAADRKLAVTWGGLKARF